MSVRSAAIDAGYAVIHTLLANPGRRTEVWNLSPEHFPDTVQGEFFGALVGQIDAGILPNIPGIEAHLIRRGLYDHYRGAHAAKLDVDAPREYGRDLLDLEHKIKRHWIDQEIDSVGADLRACASGSKDPTPAFERVEEVRRKFEASKGAPGGVQGDTFPTLWIHEIPEPGPVTWQIESIWTTAAFGIVGALPKSWKTFLTYQIAISVAKGARLFGRFACQQGKVLIFSAEGGTKSARRRIGALCRALDVDLGQLPIAVINVPTMRLDDPAQAARFVRTVEAMKPALVIVDPLREVHQGDENKAETIAALLAPLRDLQARVGCAVMLVHHASKPSETTGKRRPAERLRGSGALAGAIDSGIFLEPEGEGEDKRVRVTALHRDAIEPEPFALRLRSRACPDGEAIWLEIAEDVPEEDETERAINAREKDRKKILRAIKLASMPGRTPLRSKAALAKTAKMRPATAGPVLDELLKEGAVIADEDGSLRCKDE